MRFPAAQMNDKSVFVVGEGPIGWRGAQAGEQRKRQDVEGQGNVWADCKELMKMPEASESLLED